MATFLQTCIERHTKKTHTASHNKQTRKLHDEDEVYHVHIGQYHVYVSGRVDALDPPTSSQQDSHVIKKATQVGNNNNNNDDHDHTERSNFRFFS